MKHCLTCGNLLVEKHGIYVEKSIQIPNASWLVCENCDEKVLPKSLIKAIKRRKDAYSA